MGNCHVRFKGEEREVILIHVGDRLNLTRRILLKKAGVILNSVYIGTLSRGQGKRQEAGSMHGYRGFGKSIFASFGRSYAFITVFAITEAIRE